MPRGEGKRGKQETWQVGWKKRTKEPRGFEPVCVGCAPFLSFSPYLPRLWQIGLGSCTFSSFCLFLLLLSFPFFYFFNLPFPHTAHLLPLFLPPRFSFFLFFSSSSYTSPLLTMTCP